jgi:hypothetical protein
VEVPTSELLPEDGHIFLKHAAEPKLHFSAILGKGVILNKFASNTETGVSILCAWQYLNDISSWEAQSQPLRTCALINTNAAPPVDVAPSPSALVKEPGTFCSIFWIVWCWELEASNLGVLQHIKCGLINYSFSRTLSSILQCFCYVAELSDMLCYFLGSWQWDRDTNAKELNWIPCRIELLLLLLLLLILQLLSVLLFILLSTFFLTNLLSIWPLSYSSSPSLLCDHRLLPLSGGRTDTILATGSKRGNLDVNKGENRKMWFSCWVLE